MIPRPRLFTVAEYTELGEIEYGYTELHEGHLLVAPNQSIRHSMAISQLAFQLDRQLPDDLSVVPRIDIDLELAKPDEPGFVRCPDLVLIRKDAGHRVDREGGLLRASEVVLAVEVAEPHSRRTDHVVKRAEYADAGIPNYWIIDPGKPMSLTDYSTSAAAVTGEFTSSTPFPLTVRVDQLD